MFDADGAQTSYLNTVLEFMKQYQGDFNRTREVCNLLADLDILEEVNARVPLPSDPERTLSGFKVVNRTKLKALSGDVLEQLLKDDLLEFVFLHLASLKNLERLHERAMARAAAS